ncbi:hypothetical protein CTheo_3062 [Ceratobasidium theobromae]|uniref:Uncharacterized protein n=1 Tax=Ceratobasidium theobromae TaxID=1582974 RepID=A0A5N5QP97_9AGAM|nr:hypothetical protein CTheo_3062 [Ceratobasidium theobromae]
MSQRRLRTPLNLPPYNPPNAPPPPPPTDLDRALIVAKAMFEDEISPNTICKVFFQLGPALNFRDFPAQHAAFFHKNLTAILARIERHCPTLALPPPPPPPPPPMAVPAVADGDVQMSPAPSVPAPPTAPAPAPPQGPSESWAAVTSRSKKPHAPKATVPPAPKPTAKAKPTEKPCNRHHRVVIHVGRKKPLADRFTGEVALLSASRAINSALASAGQATRCLGIRRSSFGNLVVVFPPNAACNAVVSAFEPIRAALQLPGDSRYPDAYVRLSLDCHWSFLSMANVPTRAPDDPSQPYNPAQLLAEVRSNPAFKDLAFTRLPSWVSDPKNLTKSRSSIAFAFEDPSGTLVDRLRREEVFLFGASVSVKPWSPSKPATNCGTAPPN